MRILTTLLFTAATGTTLLTAQVNPTDPTKRDPQPPTQTQPGQDRPLPGSPMQRQGDTLLATWLAIGNDNEIQLAQLGVQRATNPEVKEFARKMIDDHRQLLAKLRTHAPGYTVRATDSQPAGEARAKERPADPTDPTKPDPTRPDPTRPDPTRTDPTGREASRTDPAGRDVGSMTGVDAVALVQELGRQCLESTKRELEAKSGAEFDRCFVGMAIGGHMKMNDEMTVFQRHASSELKTVISDGQRTVKMHLDHAKELAKKLEGAASTQGR